MTLIDHDMVSAYILANPTRSMQPIRLLELFPTNASWNQSTQRLDNQLTNKVNLCKYIINMMWWSMLYVARVDIRQHGKEFIASIY